MANNTHVGEAAMPSDESHLPDTKHPKGLKTLFFMEFWERFSYYGMRALLVLFMTAAITTEGGLGFSVVAATAIYGIYTAAVYMLSLPGGWVADRLLGQQMSVWYGGIVIAMGHFTMASPLLIGLFGPFSPEAHELIQHSAFFGGLVLIVLGTGLLKPNVSAIVGELYQGDSDAKRDAGFTLFYMGINFGALFGPLLCGYFGEKVNWHLGFMLAGIGMIAGLIQYHYLRPRLGNAGLEPHSHEGKKQDSKHIRRSWMLVWAFVAVVAICTVLTLSGVISLNAEEFARKTAYAVVALSAFFFAYVLLFGGLDKAEKKRIWVIISLFIGAAIFWSGFEQAGSSFTLFADRYTDRTVFGWTFPASWFQSLNPIYIILLAPFFSWLWIYLARRNLEPSTPFKFALAMFQLALGFLVMFGAASLLASEAGDNKVLPFWLLFTYLLHTTAELCLSPVGLSSVTKLAPQRYASQMMGTWFMGTALGNLIAGLLAGFLATESESLEAMPDKFLILIMYYAAAGVLFAVMIKPLKWLAGRRVQPQQHAGK